LAEGASISSGGITGKVSYVGGDGNDFVLILDDTPPSIACPIDIVADTDPGICGAAVTFADAVALDNCGVASVIQTAGAPSGSIFPVGNSVIEFTATDVNGNTTTCSFVITVVDAEAPTIECTDLTVDNDPGVCGANVDFPLPVVMDNCPVPPNTIAGFTTLGSFNNKTFYLSDNALAGIATFNDAIANGGSAATVESLAENTWLRDAVDAAGESGPFRIGFSDNDEEGTFTWQSGSLSTFTNWLPGQPDNAPVNADFVTIGAGGPALWRDTRNIFQFRYVLEIPGVLEQTAGPAPGDFFPVGDTTVSFTYTDSGGNSASCSFVVTVVDAEAPIAVCQDITLALDANGMATLDPILLDGGSSDNCAVTGYAADITEFDCSDVGDNIVTLTISDDAGNTASCTATVTVEDNILPTVTCMDITLPLGADGTASITPDDVATFSDNCGIFTTAVDIEDFDCSDIGTPVTVMVFAEDVNGNLNACMAGWVVHRHYG
ncbi:MAG: HYR domain-containing protein, partial [Cyanobacteria bacterium P01_A01_bin.105]